VESLCLQAWWRKIHAETRHHVIINV
jgi:hypothetical protein